MAFFPFTGFPGATTFSNINFSVPVTSVATTASPIGGVSPVAPFGAFTRFTFPFTGNQFIGGLGVPFLPGFGGLGGFGGFPATTFAATSFTIPVTSRFLSPFARGFSGFGF